MENKIIFNVKDLSKYLKISESCIRKAIKENKIPYFRIMSKILFDKEIIDDYIKETSRIKLLHSESYSQSNIRKLNNV